MAVTLLKRISGWSSTGSKAAGPSRQNKQCAGNTSAIADEGAL